MIRILIITEDNYKVDPELLGSIEKNHETYIADSCTGLDAMDEQYFDVAIIMADDLEKASIKELVSEFLKERSLLTPIVYASANRDEELIENLSLNSGRYFLQYPIDPEKSKKVMNDALLVVDILDDKEITLEKDGHGYPYKAKNIFAVELVKPRWIKVYGRDQINNTEGAREFFYDGAFRDFPIEYGIEKFLIQARQNWLVSPFYIKEVKISDKELVLRDGRVIPSSKENIKKFRKKK